MNPASLQLIIFGITGDLARRKLLPSLYHLLERDELPANTEIIGVSRHAVDSSEIVREMQKFVPDQADTVLCEKLTGMIRMYEMDVTDSAAYEHLLNDLDEKKQADSQRIYYLSIPAQAFPDIVSNLGRSGHAERREGEACEPKLLVEKPFGRDTASAQELIDLTAQYFSEDQVFRIDHYLAKETAQNIMTFRFKNPLFGAMWNTQHIERVTVSATEIIGIEGRANFYEQTGALRDILQSHLLQVLALITMERPSRFESAEIHRAKQRLLDSIVPVSPEDAARGQYEGYRHEVDNAQSCVETFARLTLHIDNEQWRKTDIVLETGKALHEKRTQATVTFRETDEATGPNALIFRLQPNEGITVELQAKRPGMSNETETVTMDFDYERAFAEKTAEAYERVIVDAIRGDQSLFASSSEVMTSWRIVQDVLDAWTGSDQNLSIYQPGSAPEHI